MPCAPFWLVSVASETRMRCYTACCNPLIQALPSCFAKYCLVWSSFLTRIGYTCVVEHCKLLFSMLLLRSEKALPSGVLSLRCPKLHI